MNSRFSVKGKVALVTGASSGLGRHFVQTLAREGAAVIAGARRTDRLDSLVEETNGLGGKAFATGLDVTDSKSIAAFFDFAEKKAGTPTIIVNNAGVARDGAAIEITEEEWDGVIETNLKGAWMVAKAASEHMIQQSLGGSIINIASILGFRVQKGLASYAASKAALIQLTRTMALELARYDIRVNAIAPGYISTEMSGDFFETEGGQALIKRVPQRRLGRPEELDGPLLLLASDASSFMTGSVIVADGGHLQSTL